MLRGIFLNVMGVPYVMCAVFAGFLCDLKGHKENTEWVGYNGNMCCISCGNVDRRLRGMHAGGVVGLDCHNPGDFHARTAADIYADLDEMTAKLAANPGATKRLQTEYGFIFCPNGLLWDETLRSLYDPVEHTLRDWMHTLASDGVGNSVLGETLNELKRLKYPMDTVRNFMMECTLPSKYGKARTEWL